MKILIATDAYWPNINGVAISVESFKNELEKLGHEVFIFAPCYNYRIKTDKRIMNKNNKLKNVYRFKALKLFFSKNDRLVYKTEIKKFFKIADEIKPDILHIQTEWSMGRFLSKYSKKRNIPLVMSYHTNWEEFASYIKFWPKRYIPWLVKYILNKVTENIDVAIYPTKSMIDILEKNNIFNKEKVIIPTGIDIDYFQKISRDERKNSPFIINKYPELKGHKILLYVGRVSPEKNIEFLIDGFEILRKKRSDIKFLIVGDGISKGDISKYIKSKNLDNDIYLTGFIGRDKINEVYSFSDLFVFSSVVESQGLVVIEAMASATPIVAIGEKGVKETMCGDNGGFMINNSLDEFVEKTSLLLDDDNLYKIKSKEAFDFSQKFDITNLTLKLESVYKKLLKDSDSNDKD